MKSLMLIFIFALFTCIGCKTTSDNYKKRVLENSDFHVVVTPKRTTIYQKKSNTQHLENAEVTVLNKD